MDMTIDPFWRHITVMLSDSPLEGPVRRAFRVLWSCIPDRMLSAAAVKARDYDRLTLQIAQRALAGGGSAVDIGAHEGEILKWLVRLSPGPHWAFEPIPACAARLRKRFPDVTVEQAALSNFNGTAEFRFLPGAAGYSSLFAQPEIEAKQPVRLRQVEVRRLDDCLPAGVPVAFIKIDVEGAEAAVLQGAAQLLRRHRPVVVFECASAKLPSCVAALEGTGLDVSFLADFLERTYLPTEEVMRTGRERGEYYYVASAR